MYLLFCIWFCYSDIEEEVDSLKNFSTELVIEAAVRCLDVIHPGLGLPHSLPDSMSARFRVGASIAQACKVVCTVRSGTGVMKYLLINVHAMYCLQYFFAEFGLHWGYRLSDIPLFKWNRCSKGICVPDWKAA